MPWKQWAYLEKVSSADFQTYLQNQVVPQFTSAAQRDAIYTPAPPPNGALCVTTDTFTLWRWNSVAATWHPVAPIPVWYATFAGGGTINSGAGNNITGVTVPSLPAGDYLVTATMGILQPGSSAGVQVLGQLWRGSVATLLGIQRDNRVGTPAANTATTDLTLQAVDKADAGGANIAFGFNLTAAAGGVCTLRAGSISVQRITAMN